MNCRKVLTLSTERKFLFVEIKYKTEMKVKFHIIGDSLMANKGFFVV